MKRYTPPPAFLLFGCLVFWGWPPVDHFEIDTKFRFHDKLTSPASFVNDGGVPDYEVSIDDVRLVSRQPLFQLEREPWDGTFNDEFFDDEVLDVFEPIPVPSQAVVLPTADIELKFLGIIIGDMGTWALIELKHSSEQRWVSRGDEVEGWSVVEIRRAGLMLSVDDRELLIGLER